MTKLSFICNYRTTWEHILSRAVGWVYSQFLLLFREAAFQRTYQAFGKKIAKIIYFHVFCSVCLFVVYFFLFNLIMFYNICPDGLDESIATNGFWSEIILMLLNTDSKIRTLRWEIVVPRSKDFAVEQNQERILFIGKELRSFLAFWAVGFKLYFKSQFTAAIYFTLWLDMHFTIVTWYSLSLLHVQFCLNFFKCL